MKTGVRRCCGVLAVLSLAWPAVAQEGQSAALAKELAAAMASGNLPAVAAEGVNQPNEFVAALAYPGMLLVVSAKYEPAVLMKERITKKEYREVYMDLQSASVAGSKVFVTDVGADGLKSKSADSVDTGDKSLSFDGEWRKSKLASEQDYTKALSDAEASYAKVLTQLLAGLKKTT